MLNVHTFDKSVCLNSQSAMREIATYLINFGIEYFAYTKCFADGTHLTLDTHNEWIKYFYSNLYNHGVHHKTFDAYSSGVYLWSGIKDQTTFVAVREYCGIDYGISLIDKHAHYCDIFVFAGSKQNPQIINFYLNNLDILWRHTFYFKDKAAKLIKDANSDRHILPKCVKATADDIIIADRQSVDEILLDIGLKKYYLSLSGIEVYLTHPEAICCHLLTQGKNIKDIANSIGISPRTVESHIISAKKKLKSLTRTDLISKVLQTNLNKIFHQ